MTYSSFSKYFLLKTRPQKSGQAFKLIAFFSILNIDRHPHTSLHSDIHTYTHTHTHTHTCLKIGSGNGKKICGFFYRGLESATYWKDSALLSTRQLWLWMNIWNIWNVNFETMCFLVGWMYGFIKSRWVVMNPGWVIGICTQKTFHRVFFRHTGVIVLQFLGKVEKKIQDKPWDILNSITKET